MAKKYYVILLYNALQTVFGLISHFLDYYY